MSADATLGWYAAHAAQLLLGVIFLLAVVSKLRRTASFVTTVAGYRMLPAAVTPFAAWAVLAVESFLAVTLLTGWLPGVAAPLAPATLAGFIVVTTTGLRRGRRGIRCGCFGNADEVLSTRTVARLVLLAATGTGLLLASLAGVPPLTLGTVLRGGPELAYGLEIAAIAACAMVLGNWLLALPEVVATLRGPARPVDTVRPEKTR